MASLADDFSMGSRETGEEAKRSNIAAMLALAGTYFIHFGDPVVACFRQPPSNDHE